MGLLKISRFWPHVCHIYMLFVFQLTLNHIVIFCGSKYPFSQVPLLARKARPKEQAAFGSNASQKHPRRFQCGQDSQQIVVDISLEFDGEKNYKCDQFCSFHSVALQSVERINLPPLMGNKKDPPWTKPQLGLNQPPRKALSR